MPSTRVAEMALTEGQGASLRVSLLPNSASHAGPPPLLDCRSDPDRDNELAPVQLLEGAEYRYEVLNIGRKDTCINTNCPELFKPDTEHGDQGRIRPGLHTGTV